MRKFAFISAAPLLLAVLVGCKTTPVPPWTAFEPARLQELDAAVEEAIADHRMPGAVVWLEHGGAVYQRAYGKRALIPSEEPMTTDTIFDAASLTKVLATT